jgi:hypothetical protein
MLNFFLAEDFKLINNILQDNKGIESLKDSFKFPENELEEYINTTNIQDNNEQVNKFLYEKRFENLYRRFDVSFIKSKMWNIISKVYIHIKL